MVINLPTYEKQEYIKNAIDALLEKNPYRQFEILSSNTTKMATILEVKGKGEINYLSFTSIREAGVPENTHSYFKVTIDDQVVLYYKRYFGRTATLIKESEVFGKPVLISPSQPTDVGDSAFLFMMPGGNYTTNSVPGYERHPLSNLYKSKQFVPSSILETSKVLGTTIENFESMPFTKGFKIEVSNESPLLYTFCIVDYKI
ncbi:hypothetical protein [Lysinibacillus capsici]|uniref:hypothetical protein n=1 Tax=Lysinibacillus capsici TaxID=2115968 RepID=UPI0028968CE9|nr:hypothetical protein [Lysinibacillus capsici]